jgi:signal transduction histidine kinase
MEKQEDSWHKELTMNTKSGEIKHVIMSAEIITVDNQKCYLKIIRDITDRVIIREDLKRERTLLEAIIKEVPVMIIISENSNRQNTIRVNDEFKKVTGWQGTEKKFFNFLNMLNKDKNNNQNSTVWKDIPLEIKPDKKIDTSWSNFSLANNTKINIGIDISQRKNIENYLREQDRKKDEFISIASHELKTPLTAVKTYMQFQKRKLEKNQDQENLYFVEKVNEQVGRMQRLIEDLLDVSRIKMGRLTYNKEKISIEDLLEKVIVDFQLSQDSHSIIRKGSADAMVFVDPARISQVLYNLLNNALKYSPGGNKILIRVKQNDEEVEISVKDFGIGIPLNATKKIFDRFYRVENKNGASGFGIGLFIASEIISNHGGRIWVKSSPGKGSTFFIALPIAK